MRWVTLAAVIALALVTQSPALAQDVTPTVDLVLEGTEGPACNPPAAFTCFLVAEGDPSAAFVAGAEVTILFRAVGDAPHNVHVTTSDQADPNHINTEASAAFANSETVEGPDGETTFTFVVPDDATELYLWCDVLEHEATGMWFTAPVNEPPPEPEVGEEEDDDGAMANDTGENRDNASMDNGTTGDDGGAMDNGTMDHDDAEDENGSPLGVVVALVALVGSARLARRRLGP